MDIRFNKRRTTKYNWKIENVFSNQVIIITIRYNNVRLIMIINFIKSDLGGEKLTEKQVQKMREKENKWNTFKKMENKTEKVFIWCLKIEIL